MTTTVRGYPIPKTWGEILLGGGRTRQVEKARQLEAEGLISISRIERIEYRTRNGHISSRREAVYELCGEGASIAAALREQGG